MDHMDDRTTAGEFLRWARIFEKKRKRKGEKEKEKGTEKKKGRN
jgi:hypothetical protein